MARTLDDWRRELDAYTDKTGDCWLWTGRRNDGGYGVVKSQHLAHRLAWQIANKGQDIYGGIVCHRCNNRRCVKPAHLYLGTAKMNAADCARSGRQVPPPDRARSRRLDAIERRQARKDAWEDAHQIEPSDLLGISTE